MGKKFHFIALVILMGVVAMPISAQAQEVKIEAKAEVFNNSGLPIPRFITLRSDKVFVRTGPALRYPIKWIFVQEGMPVEIVQEFDTWRKIRDITGEEGWIHQSLLSGKRNGVVTAEEGVILLRKPSDTSKPVALIEKDVQVVIEECRASWCKVAAGGFSGWAQKKSLYGVYATEELD